MRGAILARAHSKGNVMLQTILDILAVGAESALVILLVALVYLAASLKIVGPKEKGCVLVFGKPWKNVDSGIRLVPFGVCSLVTETSLVIQDELPTDPEKIYRGSEGDPDGSTVPPELQAQGMRPPIRVTFSGSNAESQTEIAAGRIAKDDPFDRRLTGEVVPVIRWKILSMKTFIQNIGSVDEARKQMEDQCVTAFTEKLTKVSPAVALLRINQYSGDLQTLLRRMTTSWGVSIETAEIKAIRFSKTLNAAVQNVVVKEREKQASILEGQGAGGKEEGILNGRTAGLKKMRDDLGVTGDAVLAATTARAIAGEGDKSGQKTIIAGSGGFTDLVGIGAAIAKSFDDKKGQTP